MGFFNKGNETTARLRAYAHSKGAFSSKASAFDYFFITEGMTAEEATKQAELIVAARGVPDSPEKPKTFVETAKYYIGQFNEITQEHPKIADFITGAATALFSSALGFAVGNKVSESNTNEPKYELNNVEPKELE